MTARHALEHRRRRAIQAAAEVGTADVLAAVLRGAAHLMERQAAPLQALRQGLDVQGRVHRVTRPRVIELEAEVRRGRHGGAGAAEEDPGFGEAAECGEVRGRPEQAPAMTGHALPPTAATTPSAGRIASGRKASASTPSRSTMPVRCSHASNSGAGRRPST